MTARYALFLAPPPGSAFAAFGAELLGRDAETGAVAAPPADLPVDPAIWQAWTAEPRHYGFHGTLKAPFALAASADEGALLAATTDFARTRPSFDLPPLRIALLGRFAALVPSAPAPAVDALAAAAVEALEPFREALGPADLARRRAAGLTPRQEALLVRWGYPYVLDEFRFHMTLTGPLPEAAREPVRRWLAERHRPLAGPVPVDAVALFRQPARAEPFTVLRRFPLGTG